MNNFNSLTYIDQFIGNQIRKNPNRSVSALYRKCIKKVPLIGEYLVLSRILRISRDKCGKYFKKGQIRLAMQSSEEYKKLRKREKMMWLRELYISPAMSKRHFKGPRNR